MAFYNESSDTSNIVISFNNQPRNDFAAFGKGYHFAATSLTDILLNNVSFPDYKGYPLVFLYRHAFELYLKNIIYKSVLICEFKESDFICDKLENTHNLIKLADLSTKIILSLYNDEAKLIAICEEIVTIGKEFAEIDHDSFSYRYPINKTGEYSTKKNQVVSLNSIRRNMDRILEKLEVIDFGFDIKRDKIKEIYSLLDSLSIL